MKASFLVVPVLAVVLYYGLRSPKEAGPVHRYAPDGVFFLRNYFTTNSASGLIGWLPGQEVRQMKNEKVDPDSVAVTDGKFTAIVPVTLLTQDMDEADSLRLSDQTAQANADIITAAVQSDGQAKLRSQNVATAQSIEQTNAQQYASSTIGTYHSRLNAGAYASRGSSYGYSSYYEAIPVVVVSTDLAASGAGSGGLRAASAAKTSAVSTQPLHFMSVPASQVLSVSHPAMPATPVATNPSRGTATLSVPPGMTGTGPSFMAR